MIKEHIVGMPFIGSVHLRRPRAHRPGAAERGLTSEVRVHVYSAHTPRRDVGSVPDHRENRNAAHHTRVLVAGHTQVFT